MEKRTVYSYHTFLYPFLWDTKEEKHEKAARAQKGPIAVFEEHLSKGGWVCDDMLTPENNLTSVVKQAPMEERRLDYQTFQYFNPAARKALFRADGEIIHGWKYRPAEIHNKGTYTIHRNRFGRDPEQTFVLNVNHIRLRLFNTGVGILIFELEYAPSFSADETLSEEERKQYRKDIRFINEYGRRIYPEYLPYSLSSEQSEDGDFGKNLCASSICLDLGGKQFEESIQARAEAHITNGDNSYLDTPAQDSNFVRSLLLGNNNALRITPAIDDRMFVCCCIVDGEYPNDFLGYPAFPSQQHTAQRQAGDWRFKSDWDVGRELYALVNVDRESASCQNRQMLDRYLEEQLYLRWIESGTIHAVTNHSMFCLSSPAVTDSVINPFLIEYVQLCILVLAQRASLIAFDERITRTIAQPGVNEPMDRGTQEKLATLERQFTLFQGQLLLAEVTSQIQGIELYARLQQMLFIDKLHDNIQDQLKNLFELAEAEHDAEKEKLEAAFTVFAVLAVFSALIDSFDFFSQLFSPALPQLLLWLDIVVLVACITAAIFLHFHIWPKRSKKTGQKQ